MKLFKDKKVTVMGLGLHGGGAGVAKFFSKQGAKVLVTDLKTKKQLRESLQKLKDLPIKFVLGGHREEDFINTDLIIKNPAVPSNSPYLKIARKHDILIKTDVSIFFDLCPAPIIGVTGTKGKSTVAFLIYLFLTSKYPDTILAGNIGLSPLEVFSKIQKFGSRGKVVLELSSFELEDLKKSPKVAVITTIFPDHLDRYKNFKDYIRAKKSIFKYQNENDILVLNYGNPEARKLASETRSKVYFFTPLNSCKANLTGLKDSNVSAALAVAKIFKIPKKNIGKVLSNFKGLPHRQELIATKKGKKYINDATATTPQSVILAINTFKKRFPGSKIILIAGGLDKNLKYKGLAEEIQKKIDCLILLPGTASDKIRKELKSFTPLEITGKERKHRLHKSLTGFKIYPVNSMNQAVKKGSNLAKKGDLVLLSPGAASFNLFKNEFDRGEQFLKAVKKLK